MKKLLESLPQQDMDLLYNYFKSYGTYNCRKSQMPYLLRVWNENKRNLYDMFGENLILSKKISYEKSKEELVRTLAHELYNDNKSDKFINEFYQKLRDNLWLKEGGKDWNAFENLKTLVEISEDSTVLVSNIYDGATIVVKYKDKEVVVQTGCKAVKILGKLSDLFGIDRDLYEAFRIKHSMVLNQKKITGTLCLSIHPMDYVTMSDNAHNWDSCMRWMDDPGEYRLGTIEMMNSAYVVVAYVHTDREMCFDFEGSWNSKKWRQLLIVTPDLILGNKQYPYENNFLQEYALSWLRELASEFPGYGPYSENTIGVMNATNYTPIGNGKEVFFDLEFNYMYNDIYDKRLSYFNPNYEYNTYAMNLSGPAICLDCGCIMPTEGNNESSVICRNCSGEFFCEICDEWMDGEPCELDGEIMCEWCYNERVAYCDSCGEDHDYHNMTNVYINITDKEYSGPFNWCYCFRVCDYCLENEEIFKKIKRMKKPSFWFPETCPVIDVRDIESFDDPIFENFTTHALSYMEEMHNAKSLGKMILIDKRISGLGFDFI